MVFVCYEVSEYYPSTWMRSETLTFVIRWREAFDARKTNPAGDKLVPKIFLNATNEKALNKVTLDELKMFAADKE